MTEIRHNDETSDAVYYSSSRLFRYINIFKYAPRRIIYIHQYVHSSVIMIAARLP